MKARALSVPYANLSAFSQARLLAWFLINSAKQVVLEDAYHS